MRKPQSGASGIVAFGREGGFSQAREGELSLWDAVAGHGRDDGCRGTESIFLLERHSTELRAIHRMKGSKRYHDIRWVIRGCADSNRNGYAFNGFIGWRQRAALLR